MQRALTQLMLLTALTSAVSLSGCANIAESFLGQQAAWQSAISKSGSVQAVQSGDAQPMKYRLDRLNGLHKLMDDFEQNLIAAQFGGSVQPGLAPYELKFDTKSVNASWREAEWVQRYLEGRKIVISGYCNLYFDGLQQLADISGYGRETTSNLFGLTQVILGVTGAAARQLAILAGVESFISTQWNSYDRFQFLSPEPHTIRSAVVTAMKKFAETKPITRVYKLHEASEWLEDYAHFCTEIGIRETISERLKGRLPVSGLAQEFAANNYTKQLALLEEKLGAQLNEDSLHLLYWRQFLAADPNAMTDPGNKERAQSEIDYVRGSLADSNGAAERTIRSLEEQRDKPMGKGKEKESVRQRAREKLSQIDSHLVEMAKIRDLAEKASALRSQWQYQNRETGEAEPDERDRAENELNKSEAQTGGEPAASPTAKVPPLGADPASTLPQQNETQPAAAARPGGNPNPQMTTIPMEPIPDKR